MKEASAADNDYLKKAITNIREKVSTDTIEKVYANGAYQSRDKWRIATPGKSKYRYFTDEQITTAELRSKPAAVSQEEQKKRNNVEATIFQYCFHTGNNKTLYRGLLKHKLFTFAGCLWINHVRLGNYLITTGQRAHENGLITDFRYIKSSIMEKFFIVIDFLLPRSIKTENEKSINLFFKLQIATF